MFFALSRKGFNWALLMGRKARWSELATENLESDRSCSHMMGVDEWRFWWTIRLVRSRAVIG